MTATTRKWIVNYLPEEGGRFTGELSVNSERARFVSLYESSNKTIVKAIFIDVATFAASGGRFIYRYSNNEEAVVDLPVEDIATVEAAKKGLMKRVLITMENGEVFVFDYGLLLVGKIVETIESAIGK